MIDVGTTDFGFLKCAMCQLKTLGYSTAPEVKSVLIPGFVSFVGQIRSDVPSEAADRVTGATSFDAHQFLSVVDEFHPFNAVLIAMAIIAAQLEKTTCVFE